MKTKFFTFIWSFLLAFGLSFSAVGCLVTAFQMSVNMGTVALWCGIAAAGCSLCYSVPLGLLPISALSLVCGLLWQQNSLKTSVESLLYRLSRQYHKAYDWGIIKLNHLTADEMELRLWLILCIMGVAIAIVTSRSVCRGKSALPGVLTSGALLAACLVVIDTVPGTGYLFLLLVCLTLLLMSSRVRRQDSAQANRLCAILAIPTAVAWLLLFSVIPPTGYTGAEAPRKLMDQFIASEPMSKLLGNFSEAAITGSGVDTSTVNLRSVGVRRESNTEVMTVLTNFDGTLYLRGRALDSYDGTTWTDSGVSATELFWPNSKALEESGEVLITTRYAHRMLYLPYYAQSVDLTGLARGMENTDKLTQYSFSCSVLSTENDYYKIYTASAYDPNAWDLELARYLHLSDPVWKWAEPLVSEIIAGEDTVYGRAQAIADYVRSCARYDTTTYSMPSGKSDFVQWFLQDSDTGYCVHFASAATVLLQASGIPARYVTGYSVPATAEQVSVVRAKNAHAWAEYWLPGYGWVVLEATPADLREDPETVTAPTEETTGTAPTEVTANREEKPVDKTTESAKFWVYLWILPVVAGLVGLVMVQYQLRRSLRRKRLQAGSTNARVLAYWQEITYTARLLGVTADQELFALAQKAKFSQHNMTEEELLHFETALSNDHAQLNKRSLFHRLYYRLILAVY